MPPITEYSEERYEFGCVDPGNPAPGVMQVYYEDGIPSMVDFLCPCGCGSTCPIHLQHPNYSGTGGCPRWAYSAGPTLTPSIRFLSGCKAHFNITNGKVLIHADSGK